MAALALFAVPQLSWAACMAGRPRDPALGAALARVVTEARELVAILLAAAPASGGD